MTEMKGYANPQLLVTPSDLSAGLGIDVAGLIDCSICHR